MKPTEGKVKDGGLSMKVEVSAKSERGNRRKGEMCETFTCFVTLLTVLGAIDLTL